MIFTCILCLVLLGTAAICFVNLHVRRVGAKRIVSPEQAAGLGNMDCILVFGSWVQADGTPDSVLSERLSCGIGLYAVGAAPKLLMSGDHGRTDYDEVNPMKRTAVNAGVPSADVFMDHAGFSTYETLVRAKEVFCVERAILVTQKYHLYRALYIAERIGLDACGVAADSRVCARQVWRERREILARCKAFVAIIFRPEPTFLGEMIPISGDGDQTND